MASRTINVLSVASECAPLVKTGGLADVVGALPAAVAEHGVQMRTLLPGYPQVMEKLGKTKIALKLPSLFGGPAKLVSATAFGLDLLILDAPHLFHRAGNIYLGPDGKDWPDNPERFAALSLVATKIAMGDLKGWQPQVLHCHDWQAGLVPEYLNMAGGTGKIGTVLTIHNIAFHGLADVAKLKTLGLKKARYTPDTFEFWGKISALKAGLTGADRLTTVSPTYATELMTDHFGMGLDGVMRHRRGDLSGILNGIDEAVWNPAIDPEITPYKTAAGKAANKSALQKEFGLPKSDGPLCVVVSRLTDQKGLDLLLDCLPHLTHLGGQLALLGSGDPGLEQGFKKAAEHPQIAVKIGYDEALSHRMMAGGDAILIPSRFEPCGLTQLYGLKYGTIPLVALTGGLADTVINASPAALATGVATGVQFNPITHDSLITALDRLISLYNDPKTWAQLRKNAMKQPVGWGPSASSYTDLYRDVTPPV